MAAPVIGTRPRYAPRPGAYVDRSHPLAQGLEFCWSASVNETLDLARGYVGVRNSTAPTVGANQFGRSLVAPSVDSIWLSFAAPDAPFLGPITILVVGTSGSSSFVLRKATSTASSNPFHVGTRVGTFLTLWRANANAYRAPIAEIGSNHGVFVWSNANLGVNTSTYVNGVYTSASNNATGPNASGNATGTGEPIYIAEDLFAANFIAIWSLVLPVGFVQQLYADPFCFLRY